MAIYSKIKIDPKLEKLPLRSMVFASIILNVLNILLSFLSTLILPPEIPLFYGMPQNETQLTRSLFIFIPGALALGFTVINTFLSISKVTKDNVYLKRALSLTSVLVTILAFIATLKIIFLVGSI